MTAQQKLLSHLVSIVSPIGVPLTGAQQTDLCAAADENQRRQAVARALEKTPLLLEDERISGELWARAGKFSAEDLVLNMTSGACPEQYNVMLGRVQVGYIRIRHGMLRVDCPECGGSTVLETSVRGHGYLEDDESEEQLLLCREAIANWVHSWTGRQMERLKTPA